MNFDAAAGPSSAARADGAERPMTGAPPDEGMDRVASAKAFLSRAKAIFFAERGVQASGQGAVARQPTLRLILAADEVRAQLWTDHSDAIRQQFAPELIDKQEVFGYLLNDLFGKPLLHKDFARAVGQRGDNAVLKAKTKLRVKTAEACLRSPNAALLDSSYDLQLPDVTVGKVDKRPSAEIIEQPVKASRAKLDLAQARYDGALAHSKRVQAAARRRRSTPTHTEATVRLVEAVAELQQADSALDSAEDQHREVLKVARNAHRKEAQERAPEAEVSEDNTDAEEQWDVSQFSLYEIHMELQLICCAVALTAAGCAHCTQCALRLVRDADNHDADANGLMTAPAYQGWPPCHRFAAEGTEEWRRTRRYLAAWRRSVVLDETTIGAEAWAAAVAAEPLCEDCKACCKQCRAAGVLTDFGEEATRDARAAAWEQEVERWSMWRAARKKWLAVAPD